MFVVIVMRFVVGTGVMVVMGIGSVGEFVFVVVVVIVVIIIVIIINKIMRIFVKNCGSGHKA